MVHPDQPAAAATEETHFGFTNIPLDEKQERVDDVFHKVANRYDLMNDLMSGGLHRLWKDVFVAKIRPSRARAFRHLDVAGGTGDIAFRVAAAGGRDRGDGRSTSMATCSRVGRDRAAQARGSANKLRFVQGNAEELPLADAASTPIRSPSASATCRASSARSAEAYRVLKRGGHFLCLEFSNVDVPVFDRPLRSLFLRGHPGDRQGRHRRRRALSLSRRVDPQVSRRRNLPRHDRRRRFSRVGLTRLTGGIVAIHSGWKL